MSGTITKVASMRDAIAELVRDGDTVAIEGFTHLIGFAAGHEIIRQRKRDLTLARLTPDLIYDQMIAAGVARKLVFSWLGNPGVGGLGAIRRRTEVSTSAPGGEGGLLPRLELEEYSHFGMVGGTPPARRTCRSTRSGRTSRRTPFAIAHPPVFVEPPIAAPNDARPARRVIRTGPVARTIATAMVLPADVSPIEPLEAEPIAVAAIDVPRLDPEAPTSIEALTIDELTIEPLAASND